MRSNHRVNKYPYIVLGLIHLIMLIYTLFRSTDRKKSIALLLNYAGLAYIFEYIVVVLFDGYVYKPKFFKESHLDNIFGAIWSQFFYVPVTALFITVFNLSWKVKLLFSFYFVLIERMFIYLGAFKNNWWKTKYTFLVIYISFHLNDIWNEQLTKKKPLIMFISFFNLIQVTWMNTIYLFAVLRKIRYGIPPQLSWEEHFKIAPIFGLLVSLFAAIWIKRGNLVSSLRTIIFMFVIDLFLIRKRFLKFYGVSTLSTIYFIIIITSNYYRILIYEQLGKPKFKRYKLT